MEKKQLTAGFYINYVICKSVKSASIPSSCTKFYINYVICKLQIDLVVRYNLSQVLY